MTRIRGLCRVIQFGRIMLLNGCIGREVQIVCCDASIAAKGPVGVRIAVYENSELNMECIM